MAVTAIPDRDFDTVQYDPFVCAAPCWRVRVWPSLPVTPVVTTSRQQLLDKEKKLMAIRTVPEAQAPVRIFKMGIVANKQDYQDVMAALMKNEKGVALIVDMDPAAWAGVDKPETKFASTLRRRFEDKGLAITAYQSGKMQITVRKATPLDARAKRKSK